MSTLGDSTIAERNNRNLESSDKPFYKFVLTGGPCGGKTTALARISSFLRERGFEVISCPEVYTILANNGMSTDFYSTAGIDTVIQNAVMDVQLSMEDSLEKVLKARGKPAVILCDRASYDGKAYLSDEKWSLILKDRGVSESELRDNRYNAIFHLVTAADGAEAYYTLENNTARTETPEQARELDAQGQKAWFGHAHLYVLDNSTNFEGKLQRLVNHVSKLVGLPTNLSKRSARYLLRQRPDPSLFPDNIDTRVFHVEKVYLKIQDDLGTGSYRFVRRRIAVRNDGKAKGSVYQLTEVQRTSAGQEIEQKRIISGREYAASIKSRDVSRHIIRQQRICFLYKLQSFTIHVYQSPSPGLCILHAQVESTADEVPVVDLPEFLDVERRLELSDEDHYGSYVLSLVTRNEASDY